MGLYYMGVCHTCEKVFYPKLRKLSEIRINPAIAASLGRWLCRHANNNYTGGHHEVELLGDLHNTAALRCAAKYEEEVLDHEDGEPAPEGAEGKENA